MGKGKGGGLATIFKGIFNLGKLFKGKGGAGWIFAIILIASLFKKKKKKQEIAPVKVETNYESPTYSFGGGIATSIATDNAPIPLVFGRHMVGGNIVNSFVSSGELKTQTVSGVFSSTNIVEVSHSTSSGSAIYKIASCPATTVISPVIAIPQGFYNNEYSYKNNNATLEFSYCFGTPDGPFIVVHRVPLMTALYFQSSAKYSAAQYIQLPIPVVTSGTDVYIKLQVVNSTIKVDTEDLYKGPYRPYGYSNRVREINLNLIAGDYTKIINVSYAKAVTNYTGGASNQNLYMDVILSAGEIRNLRSIYINDRLAAEHKTDNKSEGIDRSTKYRFRPGIDSFIDLNIEETLKFQSTVYNQNDVGIEKIVGGIISVDMIQSPATGSEYIWLDDTSAFYVGAPVSLSESRTDNPNGAVVVYVDNDKILLSANIPIQKAGTPLYVHATATVNYVDYQYTTQGDHIDGIVIGLNASEGLYDMSINSGAIYNRDCEIQIRIAPVTLSSGTSTAFPLHSLPSDKLMVDKTVRLSGARRTKLWYDQIFREELTPNPTTLEKKFLIEIRKITDNTLSEYAKDKLQVAYVEELLNRELLYNGCSYVGMQISANSKVNNGTPNLRFEVDGLLVPQALPTSIVIDTASSTTTDIVTVFNPNYPTSTNYVDLNSNAYAANGFFIYHGGKTYSLLEDQSIAYVTGGTYYDNSSFQFFYNNYYRESHIYAPLCFGVYKAYFKCGEEWYKRYVIIKQERIPSAPLPPTNPEHYRNVIKIITTANNYLTPTATFEFCQTPLDLQWLSKNNTALPSVPTDMVLYQWSDNPAWIILFLLCDENNGAGIPFENIDLDTFIYAASYYEQWIDNPVTSEIGDKIKRCSINLIVDSYQDVRSHIERILTICHGALYNSNDKIKFLVERQLDESEFILSLDEESDLLELSVTSVPAKDMPNQLAIAYLDENDKYNKKSIIVEDASLSKSKGYASVQRQDIDMYGLTNESHVLLEAMRIIKAGRYVKFGIQFKTALSGLPLEIYDGFKLTAPTFGWTNKKFRCVGIKINENKKCEIDAVEYYDEIYQLDTNDLINYHEVIHTELPKLTEAPPPVRDLTIYEEAVRNNAGNIQVNLLGHFNPEQTVTFNASGTLTSDTRNEFNKTDYVLVTLYHALVPANGYRVIRDRVRFEGTEFRFNNLEIGAYYKVAVEACSRQNAIGTPTMSSALQLEGKKLPPLVITYASWARFASDHARYLLKWNKNTTDFDMSHYRVRFATATGDVDNYEYEENFSHNGPADAQFYFDILTGINQSGNSFGTTTDTNFTIYINCVDTSGNISTATYSLSASATLEPDDVSDLAITSVNDDDDYPLLLTWTAPLTDTVGYYSIRIGTSTSTWANAQFAKTTKNTSITINHSDIASVLASQTGIKVMVKVININSRISSGASATKTLTLAPATPEGGSILFDYSGVYWITLPDPPANKDFKAYHINLSTSASTAPEHAYVTFYNVYPGKYRVGVIPSSFDNQTIYMHYRSVDIYGYLGDWNSSATMLTDVIPTVVSSTQMKYKVTNNGISLLLPDKSQELSWDYYDVHISSASGFTPELNSTSTSRVAVGKTNKFEINQFNDGTALESATTYYIKLRSLSKYAPNTETYHSAFNTDELVVTTSDATSPIIIVDAITPSISPINVITGDTIQIDYTVSDNGAIDRTRGRVYHVDHLASSTWIDPIDEDSHTFDLFPSSTDGNYVIQLQVFDSQGNYSSYTNYFSRDTATASAPASVSATQINTTGVQVTIEAPTETINIKEYVVEYAIDTGSGYSAWSEIRRTNATTFVESLAVAGTIKFRVKTTKIHTATLDSAYTESTPITMDSVGPSLQIDYTTPDIFLDSLLTSNDVTFHFLTSDTVGLQAIDPVKYSLDSGVYTTSTTITMNASGTEASGTVVLTDVADGSHYITFRSYDEVGNTRDTMTYYFEIDTAVPDDLDTPTIAINGRTITITIPDFTPDANFKNIEYQLYNADDDSVIATFNK